MFKLIIELKTCPEKKTKWQFLLLLARWVCLATCLDTMLTGFNQSTCLGGLGSQYCGSLANTTCICTNTELIAALGTCVRASCNFTDGLQLERYAAESCGIPNDKSRQNLQFRMAYVLPALTSCFVAARLFVRTKLEIGLGADDWVMLAALCGYLAAASIGLGVILQGFGQHTFWLSTHEVSRALMVSISEPIHT